MCGHQSAGKMAFMFGHFGGEDSFSCLGKKKQNCYCTTETAQVGLPLQNATVSVATRERIITTSIFSHVEKKCCNVNYGSDEKKFVWRICRHVICWIITDSLKKSERKL